MRRWAWGVGTLALGIIGFVANITGILDFLGFGPPVTAKDGPSSKVYQSLTGNYSAKEAFPYHVGSTWTYNYGRAVESGIDDTWSIDSTTGNYQETVVIIENSLSDRIQVVGVEFTGKNEISNCSTQDSDSVDMDVWYILDDFHVFESCYRQEANSIATDLVYDQSQTAFLPIYVLPFEVGKLWPAFPDIAPRDDPAYQWYVEAKVNVSVPAGEFKDCFRIMMGTLGDTTIRWICPGYGVVASEYHHYGAVHHIRSELREFRISP